MIFKNIELMIAVVDSTIFFTVFNHQLVSNILINFNIKNISDIYPTYISYHKSNIYDDDDDENE